MASQFLHHDAIHFGEVNFYFTRLLGGEMRAFVLLSPYSPPDGHLAAVSYNSLLVCTHQGEDVLLVIDAKAILSVVAMVPFPCDIEGHNNYYFMVEKIGLDVVEVDTQEDTE